MTTMTLKWEAAWLKAKVRKKQAPATTKTSLTKTRTSQAILEPLQAKNPIQSLARNPAKMNQA